MDDGQWSWSSRSTAPSPLQRPVTSSITTLGQREDGTIDILEVINERIDVVGTMPPSRSFRPTPAILIERAANGEAVIQMMGKKLPNIIGIRADKSKVARASGAAPMIEAGTVWMPNEAHWLRFVLDQFAQFPVGKNDDAVDAITQGLNWMRERQPMRQTVATWGRSDHAIHVHAPDMAARQGIGFGTPDSL